MTRPGRSLTDRIADLAGRHQTALTIIGGAWFALTWADYSGFIDLPDIPFISGFEAIMLATGVNALWWAWLRPTILRRRELGQSEDES